MQIVRDFLKVVYQRSEVFNARHQMNPRSVERLYNVNGAIDPRINNVLCFGQDVPHDETVRKPRAIGTSTPARC